MDVRKDQVSLRYAGLRWFVKRMESKLRRNSFKGGWEGDGSLELLQRIKEEVEELEHELLMTGRPEKIVNEAADVANMAMMLADNQRVK